MEVLCWAENRNQNLAVSKVGKQEKYLDPFLHLDHQRHFYGCYIDKKKKKSILETCQFFTSRPFFFFAISKKFLNVFMVVWAARLTSVLWLQVLFSLVSDIVPMLISWCWYYIYVQNINVRGSWVKDIWEFRHFGGTFL